MVCWPTHWVGSRFSHYRHSESILVSWGSSVNSSSSSLTCPVGREMLTHHPHPRSHWSGSHCVHSVFYLMSLLSNTVEGEAHITFYIWVFWQKCSCRFSGCGLIHYCSALLQRLLRSDQRLLNGTCPCLYGYNIWKTLQQDAKNPFTIWELKFSGRNSVYRAPTSPQPLYVVPILAHHHAVPWVELPKPPVGSSWKAVNWAR